MGVRAEWAKCSSGVRRSHLPRLEFGTNGRALGVVRSSSELASELSLERLLLFDHEFRPRLIPGRELRRRRGDRGTRKIAHYIGTGGQRVRRRSNASVRAERRTLDLRRDLRLHHGQNAVVKRLRDLDKAFPVNAEVGIRREYELQASLDSNVKHERHHRDLTHLRRRKKGCERMLV